MLEGVPKSLPALVKAYRIQDKVSGIGFDWEKAEVVFDKVKEELDELKEEVKAKNTDNIEAEWGDVIFSLVNYARFLNINTENALERTNKKFIKRFNHIERKAEEDGKRVNELTMNEMERYWQEAKLKD